MAEHRHKRVTNARKLPKAVLLSGSLAAVATVGTVSVGVLSGNPISPTVLASDQTSLSEVALNRALNRTPEASRAGSRDDATPREYILGLQASYDRRQAAREAKATAKAIRNADPLWATTVLNIWSDSTKGAKLLGEIDEGDKILVTGREDGDRSEIVVNGKARWVTSGYFSSEKPIAAAAGLSMAPCPDGSVENGLTSAAVYVYRSVCHAFPQITSYGGWDNHGEHSSGRALDIMTSDVSLGNAIADFLKAHSSELHLYDILWRQQIWTPVRASEGWRTFASRGSATANHYDHVHVSVY